MYSRYAIYAVPDGAWGDFGAQWLGWDCRTGQALTSPHPELTNRPRKYGFHGTIKPPFRLRDGQARAELAEAARTLCAGFSPIEMGSLRLTRIGRFFALTAPAEQDALRGVADACVTELDRFRAPLSEAEMSRRRASRLSARQEALLQDWGYPYVLEEFRFHLTLTGPVEDADAVAPILNAALEEVSHRPLIFDSLCLCGEAEDGRFHVIERFGFSG